MKRDTRTAIIHKEDKFYVAGCPEVGTFSQGHNIEEALSNLKEATELYLEEFPMKNLHGVMSTKRWIPAPGNNRKPQSGQLIGVVLEEGENVRWSWTFGPDGAQIMTGYQIVSKKKIRARKERHMGFAPNV